MAEDKQEAMRSAMLNQTRQHFVTTFGEHFPGVEFENKRIVRIRNRHEASVPTIGSAIEREKPDFVQDTKFLRSCTDRQIKWTHPGLLALLDAPLDAYYGSREKLA